MAELLKWLHKNSTLAQELDNPTLDELLAAYCKNEEEKHKLADLLSTLPEFSIDQCLFSYCVLDNKLPYKSLHNLSHDDLTALHAVADYLCVSATIVHKLNSVIKGGTEHGAYLLYFDGEPSTKHFVSESHLHWAYTGDIRGLEWMYTQSHLDRFSEHEIPYLAGYLTVAEAAAWGGQLECLKWLHATEKGHLMDKYGQTFKLAIVRGNMEIIEWLYSIKCPMSDAYMGVLRTDNVELLKWLHKRGNFPGVDDIMFVTEWETRSGATKCLEYALDNGCSMNLCIATINAASSGSLPILKLLYNKYGHSVTCSHCGVLIYKKLVGQPDNCFETLKWLHELGVPWDQTTCEEIAYYGDLDCLKYVHSEGLEMTSEVSLAALRGGSLDCLQYSYEHSHERFEKWCENVDIICPYDCICNDYEMCIQYLRNQGYVVKDVIHDNKFHDLEN